MPGTSYIHVDDLATALREVPTVDVARWVRDKVWAGNRPEPIGPLAQVSFAMQLHAEQAVRRMHGARSCTGPGFLF
jgi:lysine-specific demethylase/histidyl-hydroxylase NO66